MVIIKMVINESSITTFFFQRFSVFYNIFQPPWPSLGKTPVYGIRPSFVTHRVSSDFCANLYTQGGPGSSVGIATGYRLDGLGDRIPV